MNTKKTTYKYKWHGVLFVPLFFLLCFMPDFTYAQQDMKKIPIQKSKYTNLPSGYVQVGTTQLYYRQRTSDIDFIGFYEGFYYSSTFSDGGYKVAMKVDSNAAVSVDCLNGTTNHGVTFATSIVQQGELARICYTLTNANDTAVTVSLGIHADVMIGSNDRAPIVRRIDTLDQPYGLTMKDGQGAQLCILFGSGLASITPVSDYWFGYYGQNKNPEQMVGNYTPGSNYMEENGSYDSGIGCCWKERTLAAGSMVVFSYAIGVGEVNLEPNSTFEVTPNDPEGWNDLSRPHLLSLTGSYESPAGIEGFIDYAVEDNEEWIALTDTLASGDEFTASVVAMFDATKATHVIRFRTRDLVGNTTMLHPIEYIDVNSCSLTGIEDKTYTGDSLFQSSLVCDLEEEQYTLTAYQNNINAGTASFRMEGVFPHTIGRRTYTFKINPQSLEGGLSLEKTTFVYTGQSFTPEWNFTEEVYCSLEEGKDYEAVWTDNRLPGKGMLTVSGRNNYTGVLTAFFQIDKAPLTGDLYDIVLPDEDVTYDGLEHGALFASVAGVGTATFTYVKANGDASETAPSEEGKYDIYMAIADGELYYGKPKERIAGFTIYRFDETEWTLLNALYKELKQMGSSIDWNMAEGPKAVSSFEGVSIGEGHLIAIDLSEQGLTGILPSTLAAFYRLKSVNLSSNRLFGDVAVAVNAITTQSSDAFANLKCLDISGNDYTGNVGELASCLPALTMLDASDNQFEEVNPFISPNVTDLNLSRQRMDRVIELNLSNLSLEEMVGKVPNILLYDHVNQAFKRELNLMLSTLDKDVEDKWNMLLSVTDEQITIPYVSAQNAYYEESGDTLDVLNMYSDYTEEGSSFKTVMYFDKGDANFINGVDATDLQATILYAFGDYRDLPFNHTAADTYKDNDINVQDVICMVNLLLEDVPAPKNASASQTENREMEDADEEPASYIYIKGNQVILHTDTPIASLSVKATSNINWDVEKYGMMQSVYKGNMVGYSLSGITLPANEDVVIGECDELATIHSVSMSDVGAGLVKATVLRGNPTSIGSINIGEDDVEIYDVSGIKRNTLTNGIHIIKKNGKTTKLFNK